MWGPRMILLAQQPLTWRTGSTLNTGLDVGSQNPSQCKLQVISLHIMLYAYHNGLPLTSKVSRSIKMGFL